jgi:hypothetical protein
VHLQRLHYLLLGVYLSLAGCTGKPDSSSGDTSVSAMAEVSPPHIVSADSETTQRKPVRSLLLTWQPLPLGLSWNFIPSAPVMRGSKFAFSFVIRNTTIKQIKAELAGTLSQGPIVEVNVTDQAGVGVWNNLHGQDLPFSRVGVPVRAHDSVEMTVLWDGVDNGGRKLGPGDYWVEGYLIPWVRNQASVQSPRKRLRIP